MLIQPAQAHDALLNDIHAADQTDALFVWWLGQSGFLVKWNKHHLLLDPYLSDSLTSKYADSDKPHVRMTELCMDPARLDFVDVVTSSHNHTDHLDGSTLLPLLAANRHLTVVVPAANRVFAAERLKVKAERLVAIRVGRPLECGVFRLTAVPAAHEALDIDDQGRHPYLGYVVQVGDWTIYHSGDTIRYAGQANRLRRWSIDLALLPINGRAPERRVSGNLWGDEAAQLAHDIGARLVVPCHYDMFTFNTATTELFEATCRDLSQSYQILQCGERLTLPTSRDQVP